MAKKRSSSKQWLTDAVLAALQPEPQPYEIADGYAGKTGTGLLVRVQTTGLKSLYSTYKVAGAGDGTFTKGGVKRARAGKTRRVFLGRWPGDIDVPDARARAQKHRAKADAGEDPAPKVAATAARPGMLREIADAYHTSGISTNIENFWPSLRDIVVEKWGARTPEQLDATTLQNVLRAMVTDGEYPRARVLRDATRAMYNEMCPGVPNPAERLPKGLAKALRRRKKPKGKVYEPADIRAFWAVTENWGDKRTGMPGRFGLVARFALLTGGRSEAALAQLTWSNVDDDKLKFEEFDEDSGKRWPIELPITPGIRALLDAAEKHKRDDTDLVFWTRKRGGKFGAAKPNAATMRSLADGKLAGKTIKLLRHTALTMLGDLGVGNTITRALAGHSNGTHDIYKQSKYVEQMRDALVKLETHIKKVLDAKDEDAA